MGVYINTGIAGFESLRNDNYVDKSMLIAHVNSLINTDQRFICVSRMRRCGKSVSADEVRTLCQNNNIDYASMCDWFDGYQFGSLTHRFNPVAVVKTIWHEKCQPYWSQTGSWHTIEDYVSMPYEGLKEATLQLVAGESIPVDVTTCQNDKHVVRSKDEALTTLILLGYLTFDCNTRTCRIPNKDVASAFGIVTRALECVKEQ